MLDWRVSSAYLCTAHLWCKSALGAKRITRWGTFSTSHVTLPIKCGACLGGRFASAKRISDFGVLSGPLVLLLSKFRLHHEPWSRWNFVSEIFIWNLVVMAGSAFEKTEKLCGFHEFSLVGSRVMLDWRVPTAYLCPAPLWYKSATGAKRITRWGTFSTSHVTFLN